MKSVEFCSEWRLISTFQCLEQKFFTSTLHAVRRGLTQRSAISESHRRISSPVDLFPSNPNVFGRNRLFRLKRFLECLGTEIILSTGSLAQNTPLNDEQVTILRTHSSEGQIKADLLLRRNLNQSYGRKKNHFNFQMVADRRKVPKDHIFKIGSRNQLMTSHLFDSPPRQACGKRLQLHNGSRCIQNMNYALRKKTWSIFITLQCLLAAEITSGQLSQFENRRKFAKVRDSRKRKRKADRKRMSDFRSVISNFVR